MRVVMFYHSILSDWNHGNAHFLRGIATELMARGHEVALFEPVGSWSRMNLTAEYGDRPIEEFRAAYPELDVSLYAANALDLDAALKSADLAIVHEWNDRELVRRIGEHHAAHRSYTLLFHDTHHRSVTDPEAMAAYDLSGYDGVLAFGNAIRDIYLSRGWASRVWTWHEAADTRVFRPAPSFRLDGDLVWIGNWGDGERAAELREYLIEPVKALKLRASVYGVRYPAEARAALAEAGIEYRGWLPNYRAPEVFGRYRVTVHVPRGPYARALPGIPTIRVFEALACGIPLVSAPWDDTEGLFTPGRDYLTAGDGAAMKRQLRALLEDERLAHRVATDGRNTILARHTCAHRVNELLALHASVAGASKEAVA